MTYLLAFWWLGVRTEPALCILLMAFAFWLSPFLGGGILLFLVFSSPFFHKNFIWGGQTFALIHAIPFFFLSPIATAIALLPFYFLYLTLCKKFSDTQTIIDDIHLIAFTLYAQKTDTPKNLDIKVSYNPFTRSLLAEIAENGIGWQAYPDIDKTLTTIINARYRSYLPIFSSQSPRSLIKTFSVPSGHELLEGYKCFISADTSSSLQDSAST